MNVRVDRDEWCHVKIWLHVAEIRVMRDTSLTLSRFSTFFIPISLLFQRARKLIILKVSWHRIKTKIHAYINNDSSKYFLRNEEACS